MARCQSPDHPDCWHDCDDGPCVAIYEVETQLCIRGCNGRLVGIGLVSAVSRAGWGARTTAELLDVSARDLELAAEDIRLLATLPPAASPYKGIPHASIFQATSEIAGRCRDMPHRRIRVRWPTTPLHESLEVILGVLRRMLS